MDSINNKLNFTIILVVSFFVIEAFNIFSFGGSQMRKIDYIKKEIEHNKIIVDSLNKANKTLQINIATFNKKLKDLDAGIDENNNKIDKIKRDGKVKIDSFNYYNARMWESFFTNRYAKKP